VEAFLLQFHAPNFMPMRSHGDIKSGASSVFLIKYVERVSSLELKHEGFDHKVPTSGHMIAMSS